MKRVPAPMDRDGTPHPFIWYGPESQWIEHELGVFYSADRLTGWRSWLCRKVGCDWKVQKHKYDPEVENNRNNPNVYGYAPRVTLRCQRCKSVAHPWKLWQP